MIPSALRSIILSPEQLHEHSDAKVDQWRSLGKLVFVLLLGCIVGYKFLHSMDSPLMQNAAQFCIFLSFCAAGYYLYFSAKTFSQASYFGQLNEPSLRAFIALPALPSIHPDLGHLEGLEHVKIESLLDIRALYVQFYRACEQEPALRALTDYVHTTYGRELCMYEAEQLLEYVHEQNRQRSQP